LSNVIAVSDRRVPGLLGGLDEAVRARPDQELSSPAAGPAIKADPTSNTPSL
jgi:hypothetical protein